MKTVCNRSIHDEVLRRKNVSFFGPPCIRLFISSNGKTGSDHDNRLRLFVLLLRLRISVAMSISILPHLVSLLSPATSPPRYFGRMTMTAQSSKYTAIILPGMNLSRYVGHATILSWMLTTACCLVAELGLGLALVTSWFRLVVMHTYYFYFPLSLSLFPENLTVRLFPVLRFRSTLDRYGSSCDLAEKCTAAPWLSDRSWDARYR